MSQSGAPTLRAASSARISQPLDRMIVSSRASGDCATITSSRLAHQRAVESTKTIGHRAPIE
jgi:hypothetical protein